METPLKIDFHGAERSEAIAQKTAEFVDGLERIYGRMTACHVGIEAPGHHQRKGGLYHIRVHLVLPDGREVNVGATPGEDKRHSDVLFALTDAFRRARRQLQDRVRKMQGQVKSHETVPSGTVKSFDPCTGFGFIEAADGHEVYFHKNSVVGTRVRLHHGDRVTFVEQMGENGPQASTVRTIGKHSLRS
jgi:cold shock CspA family protein